MINSMTAFSRREHSSTWGSATWELRSVNHRYLEPSFKLPESVRRVEPALRELLKDTLKRGKVDCFLRINATADAETGFAVNLVQLDALLAAQRTILSREANWAPLDTLEVLRWPGLLEDPTANNDNAAADIVALFKEALVELDAARAREGSELKQFIEQRISQVDVIVGELRELMPRILAEQKRKMNQKIADVVADPDLDRLEQELVYAAQKADVDEELDRLVTHVNEVRRVLKKGGACGRRLDFLMQELNREANTLSSKSITSDTTHAAVELKVLIEQMREQVQNIE